MPFADLLADDSWPARNCWFTTVSVVLPHGSSLQPRLALEWTAQTGTRTEGEKDGEGAERRGNRLHRRLSTLIEYWILVVF